MENRKPFKLRGIIVFYNFLQVILSFYLFWEVAVVGWFNDYSWRCQPVDHSKSEMGMRVSWGFFFTLNQHSLQIFLHKYFESTGLSFIFFLSYLQMAQVCWWYFFSKFTEFFDTFFFVLRKRYDQVSTLHVIHHGIMPFSGRSMFIFILFLANN
jgi:hypothetical protein